MSAIGLLPAAQLNAENIPAERQLSVPFSPLSDVNFSVRAQCLLWGCLSISGESVLAHVS